MSEVYHVYPFDDLREHVTHDWPTTQCWCRPEIHDVDAGTLVVHNSLDQRERYETGELRPQ